MGLIRALIITAIVYFGWQLLVDKFLTRLSPETRCKVSPMIPIILLFILELLI